ncbi:MAG: iron dicitrate transport regulator FecR [Bradyrhizobiaceae bacterium PARB1]|nr:MAG: iron dicitrate transport regulator FecR [Bradyrhizobiaceae bacterium PARB1]
MTEHAPPPMTTTDESPDELRTRAKDWVVHIATGDATAADLREFERWRATSPRHAAAYAQADRMWRMLKTPLQAADSHGAKTSASRRDAVTRRGFVGGAIAASIAAVGGAMLVRPPLGMWPSLSELSSDYRTAIGEQRRLALAGDVSVEMNTRTSLNVASGEGPEQLIDLIEGEAAITVGDRPVKVQAGRGAVAAANAQFVVRCEGGDIQVTCLAGRIDVALGGKDADVAARQKISYRTGLGTVSAANPDVESSWRDGMLVFENAALARVIDEINRYRPGRIVLMNAELGRRQISARFKLNRLDAVVTQFQEVFGVKATALGGGIVIVS